jgi:hypothetical protein
MNSLYIIGGIILLTYGVWQTITTGKVIMAGKQDWLGADIKILGAGIMSIIGGILIILQHI